MVDATPSAREQQAAQLRREPMICLRVTEMTMARCIEKAHEFRSRVPHPVPTGDESVRMATSFGLAEQLAEDLEDLFEESEVVT